MPKKPSYDGFISGLVIGLVAGSFHSFLNYTKEGQQFRKNVAKQWRSTREELLKQGLIDTSVPEKPDQMLKYVWQSVAYDLSLIKQKLDQVAGKSRRRSTTKKTIKTKKAKRHILPRKFKGV